MNIRLAQVADLPALTVLKGPSNQHFQESKERQEKRLKEQAKGRAAYLVAEENGKIIGHVFLKYYGSTNDPESPDMEDLYVKQEYRSKGIGTRLIYECEQHAKEKGYTSIGLSVNPTLNSKAKKLYEKLGYFDVGRKPYIDGIYDGVEDWVIDMRKEFSPENFSS